MKAFTDPSIKVPNDIDIHRYYTNHKTKYIIFAHATPGTCSEILEGDYIFRSNNDIHFFAKSQEEVEADNDNYIEIDPVFAGQILEQNTYSPYTSEMDDDIKEKKIINENSYIANGVVLKYNGDPDNAKKIDDVLVRVQELNGLTLAILKGGAYYYATFRFMYDNKFKRAYIIKYNFKEEVIPWQLYCDFPLIEVYPVKEGNCIIFDPAGHLYDFDKSCIIQIAKNEKTAKRILNYIISKINK